MKAFLRFFLLYIWGPLHSQLIRFLAYGPWGPLHQVFIWVFKKIYEIDYPKDKKFKSLGDFFLRPVEFKISSEPFLCPAESLLIEGPKKLDFEKKVFIKDLQYNWTDLSEIEIKKFHNGLFWNFYLAPYHYHWVHAPIDGSKLEGFYRRGKLYPVNGLGRWLAPHLYTENERLTFRFQTEELGEVVMFCIGAMGVSGLHSELGEVQEERWTPLSDRVKKGQRLLAFQLGSTVIMLTQRAPASTKAKAEKAMQLLESL